MVQAWDPGTFARASRVMADRADALFNHGKRLRDAFDALGEQWDGAAHTAADDRANAEWGHAKAVAVRVEETADSLARATYDLGSTCEALQALLLDAPRKRLLVRDDWTVTALDPESQALAVAEAQRITGLLADLEAFDATLAAALTSLARDVDQLTPTDTGITPSDSIELANRLRAELGSPLGITPALAAEIGEHLAQLGLSPAQLAATAAGQPVSLPPDQLGALRAFFTETSGSDLRSLSWHYDNEADPGGDEHHTALANALLLVSNEQIGAGLDHHGELRSPGGYQYVPDDIREALANRRDDGLPGMTTVKPLADLLATADPQYAPGEELGAQLVHAAAPIGALSVEAEQLDGRNATLEYPFHRDYPEISDTLLDVGLRNTDSAAAILTGTYSHGADLPSYDRDTTVAQLLLHGGSSATPLIDWIADDATSPDHDTATRAGQSAHGLAQAIGSDTTGIGGNNHHAFLNVPHHDNHAIGHTSPETTRAIANALTPYIPNMGQVNPNLLATDGFGAVSHGEAVRIFSVIDSNADVAADFNARAYRSVSDLEVIYIESLVGGNGNRHTDIGSYIGWIQGYIEHGYIVEAEDRSEGILSAAASQREAIERASTIVGSTLSFAPYVGPAMSGASALLGESLPSRIAGNVEPIYTGDMINSDQTIARHTYNAIVTLDGLGAISPDTRLDAFRSGTGDFLPYSEAILVDNPHNNALTGSAKLDSISINYLTDNGFPISDYTQRIQNARLEIGKLK
ncbi:TPR repeat region-containing protein [Lolliginicoccus lacisalsi]